MEIQLKNIKISEFLSEETTAFEATLYINGTRAGIASNRGNGGNTMISHIDLPGKKLIADAEAYCSQLPPIVYPDIKGKDDQPLTTPMDLEYYVDNLLNDHLKQKDLKQFQRKMEKDMIDGIVYGEQGKSYRVLKYSATIAYIVSFDKGIDRLKSDLEAKVLPKLGEGEKILNTNLSPDIIKKLNIDPSKFIERQKPAENESKQQEQEGNKKRSSRKR